MNQDDSIIQLHAKIDEMSEFLDLEKFVKGDKNSLKQVRTYYRLCGWAYKRFHSKEGFVHFGISEGDVFSTKDFYYLPDTVSKYIKKGDTVMELGFGQAANIMYLAKKHPDANFIGVDLSPFKEKNPPKNITTYRQDYSSIPQLADNSVDVIYAIETIVHNTDKEKISKIYMCPVVMSTTYGERQGKLDLSTAWEILGGLPCSGICGYIEDISVFEESEEYSKGNSDLDRL